MKKIIAVITVVLFVFAMAAPVFADATSKFTDGIKQFATSPMNIVDDVKEEYEAAEFKPFGVLGGLFKGIFDTAIDAGGGIINTFTFWYDNE